MSDGKWHRDIDPPTAVASSLLRGKKLWIFAAKFGSVASRLSCDVMKSLIDPFVEDLICRRYSNLSFCVQYPGDTVTFPVLTGHFVVSAAEDSSWHVLLTQNSKMKGSSARVLKNRDYHFKFYENSRESSCGRSMSQENRENKEAFMGQGKEGTLLQISLVAIFAF